MGELWEPRIHRISNAWLELEVKAVEVGIRDAAMQFVAVDEFQQRTNDYSKRGLVLIPLGKEGFASDGYSNATVDGETHFRVLIAKESLGLNHDLELKEAISHLGYPDCCRRFFQEQWVEKGYYDLTWHQANGNVLDYRPECNVLLRYFGVRLVPHLPCTYTCMESRRLGQEFAKLGRQGNVGREIDWSYELLNMPARWSALHGIAEITTPIMKVIAGTTPTAKEYSFEFHGDYYPVYGARGKGFPLDTKVGVLHASDNGFSSLEYQEAAHYELARFACIVLKDKHFDSVVDLGCGDGSLLYHIAKRSNCRVTGVDKDKRKIGIVQRYGFQGYERDIRDFPLNGIRPDLVLVAAERIKEGAIGLQDLIWADHFIVYSYAIDPPMYSTKNLDVVGTLDTPQVKATLYAVIR